MSTKLHSNIVHQNMELALPGSQMSWKRSWLPMPTSIPIHASNCVSSDGSWEPASGMIRMCLEVVQSFGNCSPSFHEICAGRTSIECGFFVCSSDLGYLTRNIETEVEIQNTSQFLAQSLRYVIPFGKCHDDAHLGQDRDGCHFDSGAFKR